MAAISGADTGATNFCINLSNLRLTVKRMRNEFSVIRGHFSPVVIVAEKYAEELAID